MLSAGKEYITKNGDAVFIYSVDNGGDFPIHARVIREDGNVIQTYNSKGKTPVSGIDDSFDISVPKAEVGEIILGGKKGDILPTVAIFRGFDKDGFYGIVNDGEGSMKVERFDIVINDVAELSDAVDSFAEESQGTIYEDEKQLEEDGLVAIDLLSLSRDEINDILGSSGEVRIVLKGKKEGR